MTPNCFDLFTCLLIMLNNFVSANTIIFNRKNCSKNLKEYPVHKIFSLIQFACIYRNIGTYNLLLCNYIIQSTLDHHGFRICTHICTLLQVHPHAHCCRCINCTFVYTYLYPVSGTYISK